MLADPWHLDSPTCIEKGVLFGDEERATVQALWRRAVQVLPITVDMRPV